MAHSFELGADCVGQLFTNENWQNTCWNNWQNNWRNNWLRGTRKSNWWNNCQSNWWNNWLRITCMGNWRNNYSNNYILLVHDWWNWIRIQKRSQGLLKTLHYWIKLFCANFPPHTSRRSKEMTNFSITQLNSAEFLEENVISFELPCLLSGGGEGSYFRNFTVSKNNTASIISSSFVSSWLQELVNFGRHTNNCGLLCDIVENIWGGLCKRSTWCRYHVAACVLCIGVYGQPQSESDPNPSWVYFYGNLPVPLDGLGGVGMFGEYRNFWHVRYADSRIIIFLHYESYLSLSFRDIFFLDDLCVHDSRLQHGLHRCYRPLLGPEMSLSMFRQLIMSLKSIDHESQSQDLLRVHE